MTARTLAAGSLAYFDSFAGLVPCKVETIKGPSGRASSDQFVTARLTADRGPYKRGEIAKASALWFVPRDAVLNKRSRQCSMRIGAYQVQGDDK